MKLFESKYYPTIMYISLIVISLTILFSFTNIMEKANTKSQIENNNKITALVIEDVVSNSNRPENLYNYWIIILVILIAIIIIRFIYKFL